MNTQKSSRLLALGMLLLTPVVALAQDAAGTATQADEFAFHQEVVRHSLSIEDMLYSRMIPLVFTVVMAILAMLFLAQRDRRRHALIMHFLDKGLPVSPELLPQPPSAQRDRRLGTWLTGLGAGLGLALYLVTGELRMAAWCAVPLALGLAGFVNAVLFHRAAGPER